MITEDGGHVFNESSIARDKRNERPQDMGDSQIVKYVQSYIRHMTEGERTALYTWLQRYRIQADNARHQLRRTVDFPFQKTCKPSSVACRCSTAGLTK